MAKSTVRLGETSVIRHIFIRDTTSEIGDGLTGLAYNTAGLTGSYVYVGMSVVSSLTLENISILGQFVNPTTVLRLRFKEIDAAKLPGWYEIQLHDSWFSTGANRRTCEIHLRGAANMAPVNVEIDIIDYMNANVTKWLGNTAQDIATDVEVADAVFEEILSTHTTSGSAGKVLNDIATAYGGTGSEDITLYIRDSNGDVMADVDVIIRASSSATDDPVASGQSDSFGVVQPHPMLDAGTYFVWRQKSGYDFSNPQSLLVS